MPIWNRPQRHDPQPVVKSPNGFKAFERMLRQPDDQFYDWIEGSINGVHQAVDAYRFRGAPIEEVILCMEQLEGCVEALRLRDQSST
jgi:hypothetical protein